MGPISYRPIRKEDLETTADIYIQCMKTDYSFLPEMYLKNLNLSRELNECLQWLKNDPKHNLIFVADNGERVMGYSSIGVNTEEPIGYRGELTGLFVQPEYRGKGQGLGLMREAARAFLRLGFDKFVVYNYRRSRANKFYRELGGELLKEIIQKPGGMPLLTDVFGFEVEELLEILDREMVRRENLKG